MSRAATFQNLARRQRRAATFRTTRTECHRGHGGARRRSSDSGRAGQRSGRALELQGRQVRFVLGRDQRHAEADVHDAAEQLPLDQPVTIEPMKAFPLIRDLVTDVSWNFGVKKTIKQFKPRKPDAPDGTWRMAQADVDRVAGIPQVHRMFSLPGRLPRSARPSHARRVHRPALSGLYRRAGDASARYRRPRAGTSKTSTASATATSPSAAPRFARRASRSPTTRSSR